MALDRALDQQPDARRPGAGPARRRQRLRSRSASCPPARRRTVRAAAPDLADAVHLLCALHGHYPGTDRASPRSIARGGGARLAVRRRARRSRSSALYLLRLTAAVGPIPSTPGAAETEASLVGDAPCARNAGTLGTGGCALGAACALVADWRPVRRDARPRGVAVRDSMRRPIRFPRTRR